MAGQLDMALLHYHDYALNRSFPDTSKVENT